MDHKQEAQKWLDYLRAGTDNYESFLSYFIEEVQKGGFTLEDIGTSEEEIESLRIKSCKVSAQKWLDYLRAGTYHYDSFLKYLREEVQKGGLTLEDIGTSEEEIESLRIKARRSY